MNKIHIKKIYVVIAISVICTLALYICYITYGEYKHKNRTFALSESSLIIIHRYLFEETKVGDRTMLELLEKSLTGDSISILEFSKIDVPWVVSKTDFDIEEKEKLHSEYVFALWIVVEKIGEQRYIKLIKNLPNSDKRIINTNLSWYCEIGDLRKCLKYPLIFKNL